MRTLTVIVMSLLCLGSKVDSANYLPDECTSCTGTMHTAYNNSPCIDITWNPPQAVQSGSCHPTTCAEVTKCELGGHPTVSHTGAGGCGDIYVRNRDNGSCGPTVTLSANESHDVGDYDGVGMHCGSEKQVVVYITSGSAANCNATGAAGFGWTCAECKRVH
jgi:hypothetical protein